jgi:Ca2+-binding RTX toxin-like protein
MNDVGTIDNGFNGMNGKEFNGSGSIAGTSKDDLVFVQGAAATAVNAGAGDDVVFGGAGNDKIDAGSGDDVVYGGAGNDVLGGGEGNDILIGGEGNDQLDGGVGNDVLSGGSGSDTFNFKAGFGNDIITDFTFGGPEGDKLNIYAGAVGNAKNITITSTADLDALVAGNLATKTVDSHGAATFKFASGDSITFLNYEAQTSGSPNSAGTSSDDVLHTGTLAGQITGGAGNDVGLGGSGNANINGGIGNDVLVGGAGNDQIGGGEGDDILFGGGGNDVLAGGAGSDILTGGEGADTFLFKDDFGHDIVTDLNFGEGDALSFNSDATGLVKITSDTQLAAFVASHGGGEVVDGGANLLINIDADHSIKLIGFGAGVVTV